MPNAGGAGWLRCGVGRHNIAMPIPSTFTEATDWSPLQSDVHTFGDAVGVSEDDLLAALTTVELWRQRFTDRFTVEYRGEPITWFRYESLIWALGESFRRIMLNFQPLRNRECVFEAVRGLCLDRRFGKGRESFIMLLGHYGGAAQIPTLVQLLDDPEVCGHAVYALRLLGASEASERIRPFLGSGKTWVREEALKYFQKIESVGWK
jgi:hypothetical protein